MRIIDIIAAVLLVIGGLNWGSIGIFDFNFVDYLFSGTGLERVIYSLVGLSALWQGFTLSSLQKRWHVQ